jgi:hypothetical protein
MMNRSFHELCGTWLVPLAIITAITAGGGRVAMYFWPSAQEHELWALFALVALGFAYSVVFAVGLRLARFFSAEDLRWLKGTAPGKLGAFLTPRVIALLSGERP